ncbi:response regulator [Amycolatopsis magusensis]|uniref:response regulator n=1 Tax=Amycolatopsis magusensis TaxID=882444 RepID=UPI0037A1C81B
MTTVLVVDDQVLIRAGLAALIRAAPGLEVVGEASSGEEAVELAGTTSPDVILMDISMPGIGGIAATERILAGRPDGAPAILLLTTFDVDEYVYGGLRAGASGFLLKDVSPEQLLAAIVAVATGDRLFAASVTRRLVEAFAARAEREPPALDALTAREREVLRLVGTGITNAEIAHRLTVTDGTVKTHLNRVMSKLNLSSRAQAVVIAYETGLIVPNR